MKVLLAYMYVLWTTLALQMCAMQSDVQNTFHNRVFHPEQATFAPRKETCSQLGTLPLELKSHIITFVQPTDNNIIGLMRILEYLRGKSAIEVTPHEENLKCSEYSKVYRSYCKYLGEYHARWNSIHPAIVRQSLSCIPRHMRPMVRYYKSHAQTTLIERIRALFASPYFIPSMWTAGELIFLHYTIGLPSMSFPAVFIIDLSMHHDLMQPESNIFTSIIDAFLPNTIALGSAYIIQQSNPTLYLER